MSFQLARAGWYHTGSQRVAVHADTVKAGHSTITGFRSGHSADGLNVAMGIAATTDAQPAQHRRKIHGIGTEIKVQGPVKMSNVTFRGA